MTLSRREATKCCFPCPTASEIAVKRAYACPSGEPCGAPQAERTSDLKVLLTIRDREECERGTLSHLLS